MKKITQWNDPEIVEEVTNIICQGGVVLCATDTILGLLTAANKSGVAKLNAIKHRENKPYLIILNNFDQLKQLTGHRPLLHIEKIAKVCWPGPLTIILSVLEDAQERVGSRDMTIAVRIPNHEQLRAVAHQAGPLLSTSANKIGEPAPLRYEDIDPDILKQVGLVVLDEGQGINKPSTIIDCTQEPFRIIREGAISYYDLKELFPDTIFIIP